MLLMINISIAAKRILIPILGLMLLSAPISANLCLAIAPLTGTDTGLGSNYTENHSDHPDHHQTPCDNDLTHKNHYSCCTLAPQSRISYVSLLDYHPVDLSEFLFHPLGVVESFYRPPRPRL